MDILKANIPISTKGLILKTNEGATGENMNALTAKGYKRNLRAKDGRLIVKKV